MMTVNGVTKTNTIGQEQYEIFTRKVGGKAKKYCQYDYRTEYGELFSCIKRTLEDCRAARNRWLSEGSESANDLCL